MKTEKKKMHLRLPERMNTAYFNDKLTACVNTGITSCSRIKFSTISQQILLEVQRSTNAPSP
ncbi:MAG: hypothetical protein ACM3KL_02215 [Alphaproteobacteria bacterium]